MAKETKWVNLLRKENYIIQESFSLMSATESSFKLHINVAIIGNSRKLKKYNGTPCSCQRMINLTFLHN